MECCVWFPDCHCARFKGKDAGQLANERAHEKVRKMMDAPRAKVVKTVSTEAIKHAHLLDLIQRAIPFVHSEAEAFRGFCHEMAAVADQLEADMRRSLEDG